MRHSSSAAVAASPNEEYSRWDTRPSPRPSPRADLSEPLVAGGRGGGWKGAGSLSVERGSLNFTPNLPLSRGSSAQQKIDGVLILGNRSSFDASE